MIRTTIKGIDLVFETCKAVFSPESIDTGTLAMLSVVEFRPDDTVLDLGCGYGVVGILAAKIVAPLNVVMVDNSEEAVAIARRNAILNNVTGVRIYRSDGFRDLPDTGFTVILSNPPYHADFSVPRHFITKGFNRLTLGGRFYMVTKRELWYKKKLTSVFGGTSIRHIDNYNVFVAEKRSCAYAKTRGKGIT